MTRRIAIIFASLAAGLTAGHLAAQTSGADQYSALTELGLPEQFTMFGDRDPNIRRPTAIVNGEIITRTDVEQRMALFLASNPGAPIIDEARTQLQMQVLRNLIDETLQIQEAAAQEITIAPEEINQTYSRLAQQNFGQNIEAMDSYLIGIGSSPVS
ncbi:MAG: SurA N-terminal domain-containing protein, partial [Parasphingopyxis sp.]